MTHAVPSSNVDFEDYIDIDIGEGRLEWVNGHVYAMAGGNQRHSLVAGLIHARLQEGAFGKGCSPHVENRRLRTEFTSYYPDAMVVCGPAGHDQYETDANLLVEVLSPSTQAVDRREKPMVYMRLPSFEQYLLVDPDRVSIEVGELRKGKLDWTCYGSGDTVRTPYGALALDDLYRTVDLLATRKTL